LQAILFVFVRPISKYCYRRINKLLTESLWLELICLVDWWAGVKVYTFIDYVNSFLPINFMNKLNIYYYFCTMCCNCNSSIYWTNLVKTANLFDILSYFLAIQLFIFVSMYWFAVDLHQIIYLASVTLSIRIASNNKLNIRDAGWAVCRFRNISIIR
jgi:hypothetical protein